MNCQYCNKKHNGTYASGKFCNSKCSHGFSTKNKRQEINKKVSNKLKGIRKDGSKIIFIEKLCLYCHKPFLIPENSKQQFCNRDCGRRGHIITDEVRNKLSLARIKSIENGNVGYGIKCKFEGIRCDSALEYAFCKWYKLSHPNSKIERFKGFIEFKGQKYIPDFLIDDKIIVEVKYDNIGSSLSKKWNIYQQSQKFKKEALKDKNYLWITQNEISIKFYKECLREIKHGTIL